MVGGNWNLLRVWPLLFMVGLLACATGVAPEPISSVETNSGGSGGATGGPCGQDCSKIPTPECTIAVCNTGQEIGPLNTCVVVTAPKGTLCDDGKFCTVNDACDSGACVGGNQNNCGINPKACSSIICYEDKKSCDVTPVDDGDACNPDDLCQVNGICKLGICIGEPKDCSFSPLSECNTVSCEPSTGKCVGTPDSDKENAACVLTGDLCQSNKTCTAGVCGGGTPKDCTALNVGCEVGVCNAASGICIPAPAPIGTVCTEGIPECHVGLCDDKGDCAPALAPDGLVCNDHNACTQADTCSAGICGGGPVAGCDHYLLEGFETCPPAGWTLTGDWECGTPAIFGPPQAHTGDKCIATRIAGLYSVNQSFTATGADSPVLDLTAAVKPTVSFWAWTHTEGGSFDGWNLKASTNNGQSFTVVNTIIPSYKLTILGQPAYGGDQSTSGWQYYVADLSAFAGQKVILRWSFRSDGATVFPGVYVDDVVVAEPPQIPIYITTSSPLDDVYAGKELGVQIQTMGGSGNFKWGVTGGPSWLQISSTGVLNGVPLESDVGPVTVTVHVEENGLSSNFADKKFTFNVKHALYYTSFEGACPAGWTLTGDWECGVPMNVGPATAYVGTQCLATQIAGKYHDSQTYSGTTATSPDIDLSAVPGATLTFRMWVDTEGSHYDGFNLSVSSDGGTNYDIIDNITPAYTLMVGGKPAWGGHQGALGWQLVKTDLSAYAGFVIRLQFAFQSDSSGTWPGVYIDDIFIE